VLIFGGPAESLLEPSGSIGYRIDMVCVKPLLPVNYVTKFHAGQVQPFSETETSIFRTV
jgi:hypothetical protein